MRRFAAAFIILFALLCLVSCDMLRGFLGIGYTVEGQISFSASARTVDGDVIVRLLSSVEPLHGGMVIKDERRPYLWEEQASFSLEGVPAGSYHLLVFIDADGDGVWDAGEPVGGYPNDAGGAPALGPFGGDTAVSVAVWRNGPPEVGLSVSVVYDSDSPIDTAIADRIRSVLTTNIPAVVPGVSGVMPRFTVTLVSEDSIPGTFTPGYVLAGGADPVILSPGITRWAEPGWCHNIVEQTGRGIIAMGAGGSQFLESVAWEYLLWGYPDQKPDQIRWGASWTCSADSVELPVIAPVWQTPLQSSQIGTVAGCQVQLASALLDSVEAYSFGGTPPVGGEWIAARVGDPTHFAVGRQGRFLLFGFADLPDREGTGHVLFTNLVKLMADMY